MIRPVLLKVTTTGSAGSATGSAETQYPVFGEVLGVYIDYTSMPATTDVILRTKGGGPPSYNILAVSDANTDAYFAPRAKPVDSAKADITNAHAPFAVADRLEVSVAGADAGTDAVKVTFFVRE